MFFNFAIIFVVFDIEPRRARTRILKTTKKFPCRIFDRGHFYFARRGQSYYARRGQSRVPEGVKLTRLFHAPRMALSIFQRCASMHWKCLKSRTINSALNEDAKNVCGALNICTKSLRIVKSHASALGQSMNLARIKLMALLLHALCVAQIVSLHRLADAMPTAVDKDSNLRRLQSWEAGI